MSKNNELLESRLLLAAPTLVKIAATNTGQLISTDPALPDTLPVAPEQFTLTFNPGQIIDVATAEAAISVTQADGTPVNVGFVGAGAAPEELVVRFAENLTDGQYDLTINGSLLNINGEAFNDGTAQSIQFNLDLGAQVVAVVPQPVSNDGSISQARDTVVVYFNEDRLDPALANRPEFYQLINAEPNPVDPNDTVRLPQSAVYDEANNTTTLTFDSDIADLFGPGESHFRLRIGTNEAPPAQPIRYDFTSSVTTTFGYLQDEDGDGVDEFVNVTIRLADPVPGTSEQGKSVHVSVTTDATATTSLPVVVTDAVSGSIDITVSSATGFESTLADLLTALSADADASRLIQLEVAPNSNLLAGVGATLSAGGHSWTLFDPGSSFRTTTDSSGRTSQIGTLGSTEVIVSGAVEPQVYPLDSPGAWDEPGQRQIEIFRFVPSFDTRVNPSFVDEPILTQDGLDEFPYAPIDPSLVDSEGIETIFYNFQNFVGFSPEGIERTNSITENQKERVREVFDFYSHYLGVQFVETTNRGLTIARSDMRVLNPALFNGAGDENVGIADPSQQLAILDAAENWNDTFSDYTDINNVGTVNFFEEAMEVVGLLLGLGNSDHTPGTVQGTGLSPTSGQFFVTANSNQVELDYPGDHDIVAGRLVHPAESKDIDLYRFQLDEQGVFTAEVLAERLTGEKTSLLDSQLRLYRATEVGGVVVESELIAQNDDYFSEDSFLELELDPGVYFIGVSASGNDEYDPTIEDTGLNGTSQGDYELSLKFRPDVSAGNSLADTTGTLLDGDNDGVAGGVHNFWFRATSETTTYFVDRTATVSGSFNTLGTGERVYNEIDRALADAAPGTIVRILGNDTDTAYEIGAGLRDGNTFEVPQGVTVMIDEGAVLKLNAARIGVGSDDLVTDRSGSSLQVLGTPDSSVVFTSWFNEAIGNDTTATPTTPAVGDWGGIVFQENIDRDASGRTVLSDDGVFLNYVAFGEFTYGGGRLDVSGTTQTVNPIHLIESRPTLLHNTIVLSNDSAISADPNSFEETHHSDYRRIGPDIYGNILSESTNNLDAVNTVALDGSPVVVQNAGNGLFIRILTPAGNSLNKLTVPARFDDRDITHILTENLEIQGTPGGRIDGTIAPELQRGTPNATTLTSTGVGDLPDGTYSYRMTFIQRDGGGSLVVESPPSAPSDSLFITGDPTTGSAIQLTNLPPATDSFTGRRLYRSHDGVVYTLVAELNASTTTFVDDQFAAGPALDPQTIGASLARYDARLAIDPGIIVKAEDAAIQIGIGAQLIAEGAPGREVIFTSRKDDSYGAGGTFDTNDDASVLGSPLAAPGDWGGIYAGHLSSLSISDALITYGGGSVAVPGGFATFNAVEIHQAEARIVSTILENNADGTGGPSPVHRFGRGENGSAVIFVRGAQPILANNVVRNNLAPTISINANALNHTYVSDPGRSRGEVIQLPGNISNQGPLVSGNLIYDNANNGMIIRGEILTTQGIWDDTDIVHVLLNEEIVIPDTFTFGGLRLESSATQSLVVKLQGDDAGFTAVGRPLDIDDRIGGTLHIIGQPGKPVVLTSLADDTVGAGLNQFGIPQNDTNGDGSTTAPVPGDWRAVTIDQFANDRNVSVYVENESTAATAPGPNGPTGVPEFLGELAPFEFVTDTGDLSPLTGPTNILRGGGDDTLRLGFEVQGTISAVNDIDVYSFTATAGSEVWLDIDRTTHSLDTVVELVDRSGNILAQSDNSLDEQTNLYPVFEASGAVAAGLNANGLNKSIHESDDYFTTNQRDAGMRVILPGSLGERGTFYVRVRSSNIDPLNSSASRGDVTAAAEIENGRTQGNYALQLRLREKDESPGSTVRYADIRFADNGIEILGHPTHSPLLGDFTEDPSGDVSNGFGGAADVGNLLNTDQGSISISGNLSREDDIDWYQFDVTYDAVRDAELSAPGAIDGHVSVIFDMDFADDLGRANTRLSVFDSTGRLVLFSEDSNITDDRPAGGQIAGDTDDGSRGSVGERDPYIGPVELPVGSYFVAVTSNAQIPNALSQYLEEGSGGGTGGNGFADDLYDTRLEPVNSIRRIAEERFDTLILPNGDDANDVLGDGQATASEPLVDLFDEANLFDTNRTSAGFGRAGQQDPNRVPFELSDVTLFVSHNFGIEGTSDRVITTIDPFSGQYETRVGPDVSGQQPVDDIAMRPDGQIMAFSTGPANGNDSNGASDDYFVIDSGDGTRQNLPDANGSHQIQAWTHDNMGNDVQQGSGLDVAAVTFDGLGNTDGLFVAHRGGIGSSSRTNPIDENIVFTFDIRSGDARGGNNFKNIMDNAARVDSPWGLSHRPDGVIDTSVGLGGRVNGIAYDYSAGIYYAADDVGGLYSFRLGSFTDSTTRTLNTTFIADIGAANSRSILDFQGLTFGPSDVNVTLNSSTGRFTGRYEDTLFAITDDAELFAFDINGVPDPVFVDGQTFIQTQAGDSSLPRVTGLAFSTLDQNLWHVDFRRNDDGVGPDTPFDLSRDSTDDGGDSGSALYFGPDNSTGGSYGNKDDRGTDNGINDRRNLDFPGGAHGTIISNEFDLSEFTAADKPFFSFNYYLQTEDTDAAWSADTPGDNNPMRDSFRVFIGGDDGAWNLVATNNSLQPLETRQRIDEFDYAPVDPDNPLDIQGPITDGSGRVTQFPLTQNFPDVVELYDDPNFAPGSRQQWRNAYVDLSNFAGRDNLKIRFDFSTAGAMDFADGSFHIGGSSTDSHEGEFVNSPSGTGSQVIERTEDLLALPADMLRDGQRFELDGDGNFTDIDAFNNGTTTAPATGDHYEFDFGYTILAPSGNAIADGASLVINGTTFEFDKDFPTTAANPIGISDLNSSGEVAEAIANAVNNATLSNSTGEPITVVVAGNRVNFVNLEDGQLDTSATPNLTQAGDAALGEPGVRPGHIPVPINVGMARSEVALAIKQAMAETYFVTTAINTGASFHHIAETSAPNNTIGTAFDVDQGPWGTTFDADVDDGLGISTLFPHLSILGSGDGTTDFYSFAGTAGALFQADIDTTDGWDTFINLYRDNGGSPILVTSNDDRSILDSGSTTGFDSYLQRTLLFDDTYYLEVQDLSGPAISVGNRYELQLTVEGHPEFASRPGTVESEPNDALATAQDLDASLWATVADPNINDSFGFDISSVQPHTSVLGAIGDGQSTDFYSFTVTDGDQIYIDVDKLLGSDINMRVFNSLGAIVTNTLATSRDAGDNPSLSAGPHLQFTASVTGGGTEVYTIEIEDNGNPVQAGTEYDLHVSVTSQPDGSASLANIPDLGFAGSTFTIDVDPLNIPGDHTKGIIEVIGHDVTNNGPLGYSDTLPGDEFGAFGASVVNATNWNRRAGALRGVNNRIEGVWVDDIIIGVAERGHMVVNAQPDTSFRIDERIYGTRFFDNGDVDRDQVNVTGDPDNTELLKGPYTLEIRRAAEFGVSDENLPVTNNLFRAFEPTDRLTQAITLQIPTVDQLPDGRTFTLTDGIHTVVFEYEDINVANGISGDVAIPIDPVLDAFNVNSDEVVAQTIASILNSPTVQSLLDISATAVGNRVELFGNINQLIDVDPTKGIVGFVKDDVASTHQFAPTGTFDTFQFTNTSPGGEDIVAIQIALPENNFFDLRGNILATGPLFEGSDPGADPASSDTGHFFNFFEGDRTGAVIFDDFQPGETFRFNVGVSHFIDIDRLLVDPDSATAVSGSRDLVGAIITTIFDSDQSGTVSSTDRVVTGQFLPSGFFEYPNNQFESVLAFDALDAELFGEFGDSNTVREQGQIIIESNIITDVANIGILTGPGVDNLNNHRLGNFAPEAGVLPGQGAARTSVELNDRQLVPGVVIENNVIARSGDAAIEFAGDPNGVAPFGRIVNNTVLGDALVSNGGGNPLTIDGIVFPTGVSSFADRVVFYNPDAGGAPSTFNTNPADALGVPDAEDPSNNAQARGWVSTGDGGILVLEFTDNVLVASGDAVPDLHIFEVGFVEQMQVEISEDGVAWVDLGTVSGQPTSLDIDAATGINPAGQYLFVRITDQAGDGGSQTTPNLGADIDAVGAISSVPRVTTGLGSGIRVRNNASPTVLNNALVRLNTGISVDGSSDVAGTVIGANLYVDNVNDHGGVATYGTFDASDQQAANPDWSISGTFVDVNVTNLYPAPGSPLIDSSLDSLSDRSELITIRDPLGIAESPIIAPNLDVFGQTRGDDDSPGAGPGAPGANVRKDRGAIDRVDFESPTAIVLYVDSRPEGQVEVLDEQERRNTAGDVILAESDTAIGETGRLSAGAASAVRQFVLRFNDIGIGIDDAPILAAVNDTTGATPNPFRMLQDGSEMIEGVDYLFTWNSNTDEAIFTHLTEFPLERNYTILVDNDPALSARDDLPGGTPDPNPLDGAVGIRDLAGNFLEINQPDGSTQFTILLTDGVNDAPIIAAPENQVVDEDSPLVFSSGNSNTITVFDADVHLAANPVLTVTLTATNGLLSLGGMNGLAFPDDDTGLNETSIAIEGTIAALNAALEGLTFQPSPDYFNLLPGEDLLANSDPATITITTEDGGRFAVGNDPQTTTRVISVHVLSTNDPPTFNTPANPPAIDEDAGPVTLPNYISGISVGSAAESSQRIEFSVTTSVTSGNISFAAPPAISPEGHLTYEVASNTNGVVQFNIVATDRDDTNAGHIPASSATVVVELIVDPINDEPVFVIDNNVSLDSVEDQSNVGPLSFVDSFAAGPAAATDETDSAAFPATAQNATFMMSTPSLVSGNLVLSSVSVADGELTYTAAPHTFGTVTIDVWLEDDGPTTANANDDNVSDAQTITINVAPAPDAPVAVTPDYIIGIGDDLRLDASGTIDEDLAEPGPVVEQLFYSWDLDNDGTFEIVDDTNSQILYPWSSLSELGIDAPGVNKITLRVTDTYSGTSNSVTTTLDIRPVDFGDAPNSYGTLRASAGASHNIVDGFHLGASVDSEADGVVAPQSDGVDEDGIVFDGPVFADGVSDTQLSLTATASAAGFLDIWLDIDGSGTFDSDEHLNGGTSFDLIAGDNTLNFTIFAGSATTGSDTWVRARFSSTGNLQPTGRAVDGEVEDYAVQILQLPVDHEDAPTSYGAASHIIADSLHLGADIDAELTGQNAPGASDGADDDGIVFEAGLQAGDVDVDTFFTATASAAGKLDVWLDLNDNGTFETGEHLNGGVSFDVVAGDNRFDYTILANTAALDVDTWARARFSSSGGLTPTGRAADGEVEDHPVHISRLLDPVAVEHVLPMWSQTSDLTPLLEWQQVDNSPVGSNHVYQLELRNAAGQVVGFVENHPTNSIEISDPLPPGSYTLAVTPFNRAGVAGNQVTLDSFEVVAIDVTSPSGAVSETTPEVTWTGVDQTDEYEVQIINAATDLVVEEQQNVTGTSYQILNSLPIGEYDIRVRATESGTGQIGDWSPLRRFSVATAPGNVTPSGAVSTVTPTINWDVLDGAANYEIRIGAITDNVVPILTQTDIVPTAFTLTTPLRLGEYSLEVRGINSAGVASAWSGPSTFTVTTAPVVTAPPVQALDSTPSIVWNAVDGADFYTVEIIETATGTTVASGDDLTTTEFTVLDNDALGIGDFELRVTATNNPATGSSGSAVSATTTQNFSVVEPPEITAPAVAGYDTTPTIVWTLPKGTDPGSTLTEVEIYSDASGDLVHTFPGAVGTSYTVADTAELVPGDYRARIRSTFTPDSSTPNINTVSEWSTPHVFRIGGAPTLLGPSTGIGTAPFTHITDSNPTLTVQSSLAGVTTTFWVTNVSTREVVEVVRDVATASHTVNTPLNVGHYRYWAQERTSSGAISPWSRSYDFVVTTTPVIDPINPTFDATPEISWSVPNDTQAGTTHQIWINRTDLIPAVNVLNVEDVSGTTLNIADYIPEGLDNARYKVWVRSTIPLAEADPENGDAAPTLTTQWSEGEVFDVGGRPTMFTPTDTSDTTPTLSWSPVDGAVSYDLYLARPGAIGTPILNLTGLTATSYLVQDELSDGAHIVWVRSVSATNQPSPWSLTSQGRFEINPVATPVINPVTAGTDRTPTVSWTPVSGAARYDVFISANGASSVAVVRDENVLGTAFTPQRQLLPGTYRVWVRAISSSNLIGAWSAPVQFTIVENEATESSDEDVFVASIINDGFEVDASSLTVNVTQSAREDSSTTPALVERDWAEVPVYFESAKRSAEPLATPVAHEDGDAESGDAESADAVMEQWDAEIWKEESAPLAAESTGQNDASQRETIVRSGWLAGLAMLTPSLFRRRGRDGKKD